MVKLYRWNVSHFQTVLALLSFATVFWTRHATRNSWFLLSLFIRCIEKTLSNKFTMERDSKRPFVTNSQRPKVLNAKLITEVK